MDPTLPPILAAGDAPSDGTLSIEASMTLEAAPDGQMGGTGGGSKGKGPPRFSMVANTGSVPMKLEGWKYPVVLDMEGADIPSQSLPIRMNHDVNQGVGHTEEVKVDGPLLRSRGVISRDTEAARDVAGSAKNGFPWQASVGATAHQGKVDFVKGGETVVVNGRQFAGPVNVVRAWSLGEISFVDRGADGETSASVAAAQSLGNPKGVHLMNFDAWLQAKGYEPAATPDALKTALKAAYDLEQGAGGTTVVAAAATTTVQAGAGGNSGANTPAAPTPTLDQIFAEQRVEKQRVEEITRITAQAVADMRLTRPDLIDVLELEARTAIEARTDPNTYELNLLRKTRNLAAPSGFAVHARGDARATGRAIEAAVARSAGLNDVEKQYDAPTMEAADAHFRNGIGLQELVLMAAREGGYTGHSVRGDTAAVLRAAFPVRSQPHQSIRAAGWSTYSLATLLGNIANKFLAQGFNAVEDTWRGIAARRPVDDFKQITTAALTGGFTFEKVGPGGELKHATAGEVAYTNQAETYGRIFSITRKDLINDDLGAFNQIRTKLGRGGALGLNRDFWTVFMNNSAFFTSGRGNLASGAGTVLSLASLDQAQALFLNQTDPDGDPVAIAPSILLVPNALKVAALNFMNSTTVVNNTTANTTTLGNNPFAGLYTVLSSSYLSNSTFTGNSTTAWYLLANPSDIAPIEVVFLNGREAPTVESAEADFNVLGIQFRAFFDYGINTQEYRAGVKMAGA